MSDYEAKLSALDSKYNELNGNHNKYVSKTEIEGEAMKAFGTHKINPDAFDGVLAQIKSKFTVDNGQVIARDGDSILTGENGNLTVSEFVASQPEIFKIQSSGGNGQGNNSNNAQVQGKTSRQKIESGLSALMNK